MRYTSSLLGRLPANTVFYAAIPNLGQMLGQSQEILRQHLDQSPVLREWWQQNVHGQQFEKGIERIREASNYLGDEIVIAGIAGEAGKIEAPVALSTVKSNGLLEYAAAQLQQQGAAEAM